MNGPACGTKMNRNRTEQLKCLKYRGEVQMWHHALMMSSIEGDAPCYKHVRNTLKLT